MEAAHDSHAGTDAVPMVSAVPAAVADSESTSSRSSGSGIPKVPSAHRKGHRRNHSDGEALVKAMEAAASASPAPPVAHTLRGAEHHRPVSPRPLRSSGAGDTSPRPLIGASRLSNRSAQAAPVVVTFARPATPPLAPIPSLSPLPSPSPTPSPVPPLSPLPSPSPSPSSASTPAPVSPVPAAAGVPTPTASASASATLTPTPAPGEGFRVEDVHFDERESESNIVYEEGGQHEANQIRAASVGKLVDKLTAGEPSEDFTQLVLATHLTWLPVASFAALFIHRYRSTTDLRVHAHVVDVLRLWLEHTQPHAQDPSVLPTLQAFVKAIEATHATVMGHGSLPLLQRALDTASPTARRSERRVAAASPRPGLSLPLLRRSPATPALCAAVEDVAALDVAKQMALLDEQLFSALPARELLNVAWTRANKDTAAPSVMAIVQRFNRVVSWSQWTVLRSEKPEGRARTIRFLIKTARRLFELHNFAGMYALVTGLQGVAVKRLQQTWALVKRHRAEKLTRLVDFMKLDQQYAAYREHLAQLAGHVACVPYIGPYLGQLTFVEEMPRHLLHGLLNVARLRAVYSSVQALLRFQSHPAYGFEPVPWLQSMVNEGTLFTESQLYKQSLKREPRLSVGGSIRANSHAK